MIALLDRSLPFMTSNTSFQHLPACKVSFEKSADSLMGTPLYVSVAFSLAAFKIVSLSLILGNVIMMGLGVCFLGSICFGILWASWTSCVLKCVFILPCLHSSHLQNTLHLIQDTYRDVFFHCSKRFLNSLILMFLVVLPFFVSPLPHQ